MELLSFQGGSTTPVKELDGFIGLVVQCQGAKALLDNKISCKSAFPDMDKLTLIPATRRLMVMVIDLPTLASAPASMPSIGSPPKRSDFRMLSHSSGEQGPLLALSSPMRS
jgi:hypothetical protein